MAYIREYPPPPGTSKEEQDKPTRQQVISETLIWRNHIYNVVILRPTFVAPFSDRDHLGFKSIYLATLSLPLIDIKSRRPSLSICETKVAERGNRLFQSHFVMSVFHWNYTQMSLFWGSGLSRGMSREINDRSTAGRQEGITYKIRALNLSKWRSPYIVNLKKVTLSRVILKKRNDGVFAL